MRSSAYKLGLNMGPSYWIFAYDNLSISLLLKLFSSRDNLLYHWHPKIIQLWRNKWDEWMNTPMVSCGMLYSIHALLLMIIRQMDTNYINVRAQEINNFGKNGGNDYTRHSYARKSRHWGRGKSADISQTTVSNAFSWMKMDEFRLKFHWSWFLKAQLTIFQHCFR